MTIVVLVISSSDIIIINNTTRLVDHNMITVTSNSSHCTGYSIGHNIILCVFDRIVRDHVVASRSSQRCHDLVLICNCNSCRGWVGTRRVCHGHGCVCGCVRGCGCGGCHGGGGIINTITTTITISSSTISISSMGDWISDGMRRIDWMSRMSSRSLDDEAGGCGIHRTFFSRNCGWRRFGRHWLACKLQTVGGMLCCVVFCFVLVSGIFLCGLLMAWVLLSPFFPLSCCLSCCCVGWCWCCGVFGLVCSVEFVSPDNTGNTERSSERCLVGSLDRWIVGWRRLFVCVLVCVWIPVFV